VRLAGQLLSLVASLLFDLRLSSLHLGRISSVVLSHAMESSGRTIVDQDGEIKR